MLANYQAKLYGLLSRKTGNHITTLNDALMKLHSPVDKALKAKLRKLDMLGKIVRHLTPALLDTTLSEVDAGIVPNTSDDDDAPPGKMPGNPKAEAPVEADPKQLTLTAVFEKQLLVKMEKEKKEVEEKKADQAKLKAAEFIAATYTELKKTWQLKEEKRKLKEKCETKCNDSGGHKEAVAARSHDNLDERTADADATVAIETDDWVIVGGRLHSVIRIGYGDYENMIRVAGLRDDPRCWTHGRWVPRDSLSVLRLPARFETTAGLLSAADPPCALAVGTRGLLLGFDADGDGVITIGGARHTVFDRDMVHLWFS